MLGCYAPTRPGPGQPGNTRQLAASRVPEVQELVQQHAVVGSHFPQPQKGSVPLPKRNKPWGAGVRGRGSRRAISVSFRACLMKTALWALLGPGDATGKPPPPLPSANRSLTTPPHERVWTPGLAESNAHRSTSERHFPYAATRGWLPYAWNAWRMSRRATSPSKVSRASIFRAAGGSPASWEAVNHPQAFPPSPVPDARRGEASRYSPSRGQRQGLRLAFC